MAISKRIVLAIILIVLCLAALAVFVSLNGGPTQDTIIPTRESAIPKDAIKVTPQTDTFPPILHSDEWNLPVPLPQSINTAGAEDSPFVMPDGNTLYFFFTPNASVPPEKQILDNVTGIYVSKKQMARGPRQPE